jgi:hypothetical protein
MIDSKRRLIYEEDDELDTVSLVLIGRCHLGSVVRHEVYDQTRQEYDLKLYWDYFLERPR